VRMAELSRALKIASGLIAALLACLRPTLVQAACSGSETYHFTARTSATVVASIINGAMPGASFCFDGGVKWRMASILRPANNQTFIANGPNAVLDGSVLLPNTIGNGAWSAGSGYYSITAARAGLILQKTSDRGITCFSINPGCAYRQDLYLNGVPLVHVLPSSFPPTSSLITGQWAADYAHDVIYMHDSPAGQTVEMSSTPAAISSNASGVMINGLIVQKYATSGVDGAIRAANSWTVRNSEARFNHGEGVGVQNGPDTSHNLVENNSIHDNGEEGIGLGGHGLRTGNQLIGNRIYNNGNAALDAPGEYGGIKASAQKNLVIRGNIISNNDGSGIWLDVGTMDAVLSHNVISGSTKEGLRIESSGSNGAIRVVSNTLRSNAQNRVNLAGLMYAATGSCTGFPEIGVDFSSNVSVLDNSITTSCAGIQVTAGSNDYVHDDLVQGNSLTYRGRGVLRFDSLTGGRDNLAVWRAHTAYRPFQSGAPYAVLDANGNTATTMSTFISGASAPHWCTSLGCTTSDNGGTWILRSFGRSVYNANNRFRANKYCFVNSSQLANSNWMWSTTNQPGINPVSWTTWLSDGQDPGGRAVAPAAASCSTLPRGRHSATARTTARGYIQ
jgi:parallel beta helix pectate lyase-like protein